MDKRLVIFGIIAAVLIIGGIVAAVVLSSSSSSNNSGSGSLNIAPQSFDWGTLSMAAGTVSKAVELKNNSQQDITVEDLNTSCACTTVYLEKDGKKSPVFGMPGHGVKPLGWSERLKAGENAKLVIIFDPAAHGPQGTGLVTRIVNIYTNEAGGRYQIRFDANVIP